MNQTIDPYRFLFPLGWFLGICGVLLWPLYFYKGIAFYPNIMHARVMIEGFSACFILGFLSTALPQMMETHHFKLYETLLITTGMVCANTLQLFGQGVWADGLFAFTLLLFIGMALSRVPSRQCMPPAGIVAVFLGLMCAIFGSVLQALYLHFSMPAFIYPFSRLLLYQGFLLLPIMGIGAFILPVFIGYERKRAVPFARDPSPAWKREATAMLLFSIAVISSFAVEAAGLLRTGYILRTAIVIIYLGRYIPVYRRHRTTGTAAWLKRLALLAIPIGYAFAAAWPVYFLPWLHIVYITGFALLIWAVATRVVIAHGGKLAHCMKRSTTLWVIYGLIVLAMLTRVTADWTAELRFSHYAYAGMAWIIAALLWAGFLFRYLVPRKSQ